MSIVTAKGNLTLTGASIGAVAYIRTISISGSQGTWDTTANDTTTARTYLGTWSDGTMTVTGIFDNDNATHQALETYSANATADTITIRFRDGAVTDGTWAASCIMTEFTVDGDYEGGWTFSATFQKSGDATWTASADA